MREEDELAAWTSGGRCPRHRKESVWCYSALDFISGSVYGGNHLNLGNRLKINECLEFWRKTPKGTEVSLPLLEMFSSLWLSKWARTFEAP